MDANHGNVMINSIETGNISVDKTLFRFINDEALPGSGVAEVEFWTGLEGVIAECAPQNKALLTKRESAQVLQSGGV